ncbi:MAG: hypothetical protein K0U37_05095 [Gammaproteobacteria bacterium]|nr:hypothetical protein [Gammaproteobacteria bacterium]
MIKFKKVLTTTLSLLLSMTLHAGTAAEKTDKGFSLDDLKSKFSLDDLKLSKLNEDTSWLLHIGGFFSHQGVEQHINLNGLVGNDYSPTRRNSGNVIVGVGLLRPGTSYKTVDFEYGVQLYYLSGTTTSGVISIENVLPNLSYSYTTTFLPLYANVKANIETQFDKTKLTLDVGVGPDFMTLTRYREAPRTAATIPNSFYSRQTKTQFATLFGVGLKSDKFADGGSLEIAYKFFYLGQSKFTPNNNQVLNSLNTGSVFANAITLTART